MAIVWLLFQFLEFLSFSRLSLYSAVSLDFSAFYFFATVCYIISSSKNDFNLVAKKLLLEFNI